MDNETTSRSLNNSAIGSWSGYVYQGLCALLHCLKLIADDKEKYKDYHLYLDSYEDFAIMGDDNRLVSLHQCKNEKAIKDYSCEYRKMFTKKSRLKDLCRDDCDLYFHTNREVETVDGIKIYPFTPTQSYCEPGGLICLIEKQVEDIIKKDEQTIKKVSYSLIALIDQKVLDIHQRYIQKENREALRKVSEEKDASIDFQIIIDRLFAEEEVFSYDRESFVTRIKYKLIEDLNAICEDVDNEDLTDSQKERVRYLSEGLMRLNVEGMEYFLKRIHPIDDVTTRSIDSFADIANKEKARNLFDIISDLEPLGIDLDWNTDKGKETPTSLNSRQSVATLCKKIIKNINNHNSLYEYDWLVGNVLENVVNIGDFLQNISNITDKSFDGNSIFKTKKVGLVTKQNRKDGNY